jgi:hypothetical protein
MIVAAIAGTLTLAEDEGQGQVECDEQAQRELAATT